MGKAALDLPDPLQAPPEGAKTSTDELLAQLAGDEIDRLLAEADAAQPPNSRAPFHVAPPTTPGISEESYVAPEAALRAAPVDPEPQPRESPSPSPTAADVSAEMDALFSAAVARDDAADAAGGAVADDAAASAVTGAAAEAELETTAAERAGLQARLAPSNADAMPPEAAPEADADDAPLPLYLRPLEWLNAPLALLPESVRDLVGKIAILTLLNAAAILTYVLVVRRGQ